MDRQPRLLSLCSGYGGLDLAAEEVFGAETCWVADIDRDACSVLAERFPHAPNLGDFTAIDWAGFGHVDVLTAGYPCQPFSTAGQRKGSDDDRHIWPEVLRAVRTLRPGTVVLENVAGHLSLGFGRVLGDLAEAGFDAEWVCLRAADVGAPHGRARLFVVATNTDREPAGRHSRADARSESEDAGRAEDHRHRPADGGRTAPDAGSERRIGRSCVVGGGRHQALRGEASRDLSNQAERIAPDADGDRCEGLTKPDGQLIGPFGDDAHRRCLADHWGSYAPAVERWERILGRPAPAPLAANTKQLNARFVEWMMGLPEGWVTDIVPNRRALHTLGNGVVPQQAAAALRMLTGGFISAVERTHVVHL